MRKLQVLRTCPHVGLGSHSTPPQLHLLFVTMLEGPCLIYSTGGLIGLYGSGPMYWATVKRHGSGVGGGRGGGQFAGWGPESRTASGDL